MLVIDSAALPVFVTVTDIGALATFVDLVAESRERSATPCRSPRYRFR